MSIEAVRLRSDLKMPIGGIGRRLQKPIFGNMAWHETDAAARTLIHTLGIKEATVSFVNGNKFANFYSLAGKDVNLTLALGRNWLNEGEIDPLMAAHKALADVNKVDPDLTGKVGKLSLVEREDTRSVPAYSRENIGNGLPEGTYASILCPPPMDNEEFSGMEYHPRIVGPLVDQLLALHKPLGGKLPVLSLERHDVIVHSWVKDRRQVGGTLEWMPPTKSISGDLKAGGYWHRSGGEWVSEYAHRVMLSFCSALEQVAANDVREYLTNMLASEELFGDSTSYYRDFRTAVAQMIREKVAAANLA